MDKDTWFRCIPGTGMNPNDLTKLRTIANQFQNFQQNAERMNKAALRIMTAIGQINPLVGELRKKAHLDITAFSDVQAREATVNLIYQTIWPNTKLKPRYVRMIQLIRDLQKDMQAWCKLQVQCEEAVKLFVNPVDLIIKYTWGGFMIVPEPSEGYNILNEVCKYRICYHNPNHHPDSRRPEKETIDLYSITDFNSTINTYHRAKNEVSEDWMKPEWIKLIELDNVLNHFLSRMNKRC